MNRMTIFDPLVQDEAALILAVDDDLDLITLLVFNLRKLGYRVVTATDGQSALTAYEQYHPQLVLLDADLPGMDGFAVCAAIKQLPEARDIPVIMVTGLEDDSSVDRAFAAGAEEYITKPIHWAVMRQRLRLILEGKRLREQLRQQAEIDYLTGLPNRARFHDRLEQALALGARTQRKVALIFIDLDHFKQVNDTLGHDAGDQLLREAARRLVGCVRKSDTVARLGGDEFTVIIQNPAQLAYVELVCRKILEQLTLPFLVVGREVSISASLGITIFPDDGYELSALLKQADSAMYRAKEMGRNTFCYFATAMNLQARERVLLEHALELAIANGEMELYFQPKFDLSKGRIDGVEALVRWRQDAVVLSPGEFLPIAEESGLIFKLGGWILDTACRQGREWLDAGLHFGRIAVNLSPRQFSQRETLINAVRRALSSSGLPSSYLELEINEGMLLDNTEQAILTMDAISGMGVKISLDDFGTGYFSLGTLKRLPLSSLKIDRSFVHKLEQGDSDTVSAIISLAENLHFDVVAEGVETRQQADRLKQDGCNMVQGYFFSHPLPAAAITELLRGKPGGGE